MGWNEYASNRLSHYTYLIISMDCLKKAGSLITWPSSGFCSTSAFICGLLMMMERTKSIVQSVNLSKEHAACYNRTCVSHNVLHERRVHHLTHHFRIHIGHLHISKRRGSRWIATETCQRRRAWCRWNGRNWVRCLTSWRGCIGRGRSRGGGVGVCSTGAGTRSCWSFVTTWANNVHRAPSSNF